MSTAEQIPDNTKRRYSRRERGWTHQVRITRRDLDMLSVIYRHGPTRTPMIQAVACPASSEQVVRKRLKDLHRRPNAYVDRPKQQDQHANANYRHLIYDINKKGIQLLKEHGRITPEMKLWHSNRHKGEHVIFAHQVMISDIMCSIEAGVNADPSARFVSWYEILESAPAPTRTTDIPTRMPVAISYQFPETGQVHHAQTHVQPDAIFGIEYDRDGQKSYRFFVLEADRATEPVRRSNLNQTSFLKKALAYRQFIGGRLFRERLGIEKAPMVLLNVTTRERHMQSMMELVDELSAGNGNSYFLFKTIPTLGDFGEEPKPDGRMYTEPWARVGNEARGMNS